MTETTQLPVVAGIYEYTPAGDEPYMNTSRPQRARLQFERDTLVRINGIWHRLDQLPGKFRGPLPEEGNE